MIRDKRSRMKFCQIVIIISLLLISENGLVDDEPPFVDPKIASGEKNTYEVVENGRFFRTVHTISRKKYKGREVYMVDTDTYHMVLEASSLRPILIRKTNSDGEIESSIEYTGDRVHFIYPGPKRNKVEEVPEDRYDLNTILEVVRGFPFEKEKVEFTLVTSEHIVGAYFEIISNERVTVPAGTFDCYKLKGGISGLIGKVFRKKFLFWVEKKHPHKVIKYKDSSGERLMELVCYEVVKK